EQTLSEIGDITGRAWESQLRRQRGEILLSLNPARAGEAEADFNEAIKAARRQSAKSLELRTATSLATLWRTQGRLDEARNLIGPIYSWFSEGADTKHLRRARDVQMALSTSDLQRLN